MAHFVLTKNLTALFSLTNSWSNKQKEYVSIQNFNPIIFFTIFQQHTTETDVLTPQRYIKKESQSSFTHLSDPEETEYCPKYLK